MADPPLFSDSKHRDLQPSLFAREFDPPLPEDTARRVVNHAAADAAKAKKERKKAKKERAKLQHGNRRQGSEESDDDKEEGDKEEEGDKSDPNIPWGTLALEDE